MWLRRLIKEAVAEERFEVVNFVALVFNGQQLSYGIFDVGFAMNFLC